MAFVCCGAVRRLETAESGLDGRKPCFGHEIAVRRYRPVRKFGRVVLGFLDERAAHFGLPVLHRSSLRLEHHRFSLDRERAFRSRRSLHETVEELRIP